MPDFDALISDIRACRICEPHLDHEPRPILRAHPSARVLIASQAPGRKVHGNGVPFDDPSGDRLRDWMGVTREAFYDAESIAILPMGFCYPGHGPAGDLPPRPECAPAWRAKLLDRLTNVELTLVIGRYAQDYHMGAADRSVTETVRAWRDHWPGVLPLPHPSPRNKAWLKRNPWFEREVLPALRSRVEEVLSN